MAEVQVIALGGSLLRPEEEEGRDMWFSRLKQMIVHLEGMDYRIGIVVGGGAPAREGIEIARSHVSDERRLDEIGIAATRINATIIQQVLAQIGIDVAPSIPHSTKDGVQLLNEHSVVCMGGTLPGHTTDAVAVSLAAEAGASGCIIATNVPYVYDSDPRKNPEAKFHKSLTLSELAEICGVGKPLAAGASAVVDPVAIQRALDDSLSLAIVDGRYMDRLENAILGLEFEGTMVSP